ncbi:MAG: PqqD family protein [Clostridia bacterium]|nr:PqqD family protein [Clostridia bacterium]
MKVSNQFIMRKIADEHLLIPVGEAAMSVKGLIALSESGVLLYEKLQNGCTKEELIAVLTAEYEVSAEGAEKDTEAFLDQMRELGMLVEDPT